jgi:hypothetical protein
MRLWICVLVLAAIGCAAARAQDAAKELRAECEGLIGEAVKRPFGWGWAVSGEVEKGKTVVVDVKGSAAAGFLLWRAGEVLREPKFTEAARQVGRGLAAGQHQTGKFAGEVTFGATSAVDREAMTALVDRSATRAALGFLLTVCEGKEKESEAIARAAARGARWLDKQQADSGAWPVMWPAAGAKGAMRLVRLDTAETRDCVLAMLLAYEVLGDPFYRSSVEKSVEWLLERRYSTMASVGGGLWQTAYSLGGRVDERPEFGPKALDLLASRYSLQTVLSVYIVLGEGTRLMACETAAKSMKALMDGEGAWHRRFGLRGEVVDAGTMEGGALTPAAERRVESDAVLAGVLEGVQRVREAGREKMAGEVKGRLAEVVVGLSDSPVGGVASMRLGGAVGERVGRGWEAYLKVWEAK